LQNTFYALGETRAPARIAALRVLVSAALGLPLMFVLDRYTVPVAAGAAETPLHLGAVGLALASGAGSWLELLLLRRALATQGVGAVLPWPEMAKMTGLAVVAVLPSTLLWWLLPAAPEIVQALLVIGVYAGIYLLLAKIARMEEEETFLGGLKRRLARR
jgi:putative peptidoglycan lipid II flippase